MPGYKDPPKEYQWKKGNPGKKLGTKNKTTLLKEKILTAALAIDFKGHRKTMSAMGRMISVLNIRPDELIKVAASFVPKEQTVKMDLADGVVEKYAAMSTEQLKLKANELLNPKKD